MKCRRIYSGCMFTLFCVLSGSVGAQVVTEFSCCAPSSGSLAPAGIAAGPDGNLWFTELDGNRIGRITPQGVVTEFSAGITAGARPFGIAAGPDGNLWFAEIDGNRIGRITTAGGSTPPVLASVVSRRVHGGRVPSICRS